MATSAKRRVPIAKLVPPRYDKNWSFQVVNRLEDHDLLVRVAMTKEEIRNAKPFLQGLDSTWLMVEFWTDDISAIRTAAGLLAQQLNLVLGEGDFSRTDIGLE